MFNLYLPVKIAVITKVIILYIIEVILCCILGHLIFLKIKCIVLRIFMFQNSCLLDFLIPVLT